MSVLACERIGCRNIMCERLVDGHYICNACAEEFRELAGDDCAIPINDMRRLFKKFLEIDRPKSSVCVTASTFLESGFSDAT